MSPPPLRTPHRSTLTLVFALLVSMLGACASAPTMGVRRGFETTKIAVLNVAPPYATSHFGIEDGEWLRFEQITVHQMADALRGLGFQVVTPEALRDQLERDQNWERFTRLMEFDGGLDNRFEPSLYAPASAEVAELQELTADGVLDEEPLLFVELVYQSTGECTLDSREYNRFATVVTVDGTRIEDATPGPCIVTHLQAKLVDPASASTMWHNRVLREMRGRGLTTDDALENLRVATDDLLRGPHGLGTFAPLPQ